MLYLLLIVLICVIASVKFRRNIGGLVDWVLEYAPGILMWLVICGLLVGLLVFVISLIPLGLDAIRKDYPNLWSTEQILAAFGMFVALCVGMAFFKWLNLAIKKKYGENKAKSIHDFVQLAIEEVIFFVIFGGIGMLILGEIVNLVISFLIVLILFAVYIYFKYCVMRKLKRKTRV